MKPQFLLGLFLALGIAAHVKKIGPLISLRCTLRTKFTAKRLDSLWVQPFPDPRWRALGEMGGLASVYK